MGDLLGEDFDLVQKDNLYRCLDKLLAHKTELFSFLQQRWTTLFEAKFDQHVLRVRSARRRQAAAWL
jgi:hypothetical protein